MSNKRIYFQISVYTAQCADLTLCEIFYQSRPEKQPNLTNLLQIRTTLYTKLARKSFTEDLFSFRVLGKKTTENQIRFIYLCIFSLK